MLLTVTFPFASNSPPLNVAYNPNDFLQVDCANVVICLFHLKEDMILLGTYLAHKPSFIDVNC